MHKKFSLHAVYKPAGDQPQAIESLVSGLNNGLMCQTLLGVTGSGKTFTMAHVIANTQRSAIIMAHNKTLAAQLYGEMQAFFPHNAVEYFVSYYDYYQPEAYVPSTDTYIEKDAAINEHIEQMRLSATKALLERKDVIVVATVSAIYGLGAPETYLSMVLHLSCGEIIDQRSILQRLVQMQYTRSAADLGRGNFRVRGDIVDIYPAESDKAAIRVELFDEEVNSIVTFDPLTGKVLDHLKRVTIFPKTHYVTPRETISDVVEKIKVELNLRLMELRNSNKLLEAQRLEQRTLYDIEMMQEAGYCNGIENYSRFLSKRNPGEPPPTLLDYLPRDAIMFIDESHVTIPQIGAMYKGDRARKENLVNYGFRLPSALDNRPLKFLEFEARMSQTIFVSATPSVYEAEHTGNVAEQIVRPTGLVDPQVVIRPVAIQVDDLLSEIRRTTKKNERVLVTTLTKRTAEDLTEYLSELNVKVRYLHSDIDTVERVEILRNLRLGVFDVLVGINLLREGLDIPEVSLVAILDADKEGFLRSERSLIQTIGRAARNINGRAILYADVITGSIERALAETDRRREKQIEFNKKHNITPKSIQSNIKDIMKDAHKSEVKAEEFILAEEDYINLHSPKDIAKEISRLEKKMLKHARDLEFENAASVRDKITALKKLLIQ